MSFDWDTEPDPIGDIKALQEKMKNEIGLHPTSDLLLKAIRENFRIIPIVYDENLGHHRLDPYPPKEETEAYYEEDHFYSEHSPADWLEKEAAEYRAGLWDAYFSYLIQIGGGAPCVLDYGCGAGWFLHYYQNKANYYICQGVEPSESAISAGWSALGEMLPIFRNLEIIETASKGEQKYNLIYLNLVLEHIVYPKDFLKYLLDQHLRPGGRMVIVVPNDINPLQRRLNYKGYISPVHVNYFTPDTLRGVMEKAGLKVVHESATFPMELFPLVGINYFGNDALGRKCHRARLRLEKLIGPRIYNLYQKLYNRWGIGRELIFVGEKA